MASGLDVRWRSRASSSRKGEVGVLALELGASLWFCGGSWRVWSLLLLGGGAVLLLLVFDWLRLLLDDR